jgi:hypothetical protein
MTSSKEKSKLSWLQQTCHSADRINMEILIVNLTNKDLDIPKEKGRKKGRRERETCTEEEYFCDRMGCTAGPNG